MAPTLASLQTNGAPQSLQQGATLAAGTTAKIVGQNATGGLQVATRPADIVNDIGPVPESRENLNDTAGRRVRLRAKPNGASKVYGNGIMNPLVVTNGMVFPYQPTITYQQDVVYSNMELVHSNQDFLSYTRTPALKLSIDGEFTVQNQKEGLYAMACIHFLRTSTKMWFGGGINNKESEEMQGTPPPVLLFDAYGQYMFNSLPVVITQFGVTLPKDVDYVPVKITNNDVPAEALQDYQNISKINDRSVVLDTRSGYAWLPAVFNIQVHISVQNTPRRLRAFDLAQFRNGSLLRGGGWA